MERMVLDNLAPNNVVPWADIERPPHARSDRRAALKEQGQAPTLSGVYELIRRNLIAAESFDF
jgi:hypothetical protein